MGQLIRTHAARLDADLGDHLLGGFCFDQRGEAAVVELAADSRKSMRSFKEIICVDIF